MSRPIDGYAEDIGTEPRFTFTWEGRGEMDPVHGSGWLRLTDEEETEGMIKIHPRFQARKAS